MNKYAFATLAVGTTYNYKVRTLIDCVLQLTSGDMIVITDDVEDIQEYLNASPHMDVSRVTVIQLSDVTKENVWYAERMFNFNLKRLPVTVANSHDDYDMIVHADADAFFIGWNEDEFQQFINDTTSGMIARFRNRPGEEGGIHWIIEKKAKSLSIDMNTIKARMPIEVFMFFKPKHPKFKTFLEQWKEITDRCYNRGIDPFIEALEISYALDQSKLEHQDILPFLRTIKVLNGFRYLHHDKIMKII